MVFATSKGTPIDAQNIINRFLKPLLKRAESPDIRWHDLRHTYATLLLARGTHRTYVQKSLGYASVQLTLDRSCHWLPSMGRNTAEGIDEALGQAPFTLALRFSSLLARDASTARRGPAASSPSPPHQIVVERLQIRLVPQLG